MALDDPHATVVRRLVEDLEGVTWALTGSTSFALQGVPLEPDDVDVQTTAAGAREIAARFADHVVEPVSRTEGDGIRSHLGRLRLSGLDVEVIGDLQKRRPDGTREDPVDVTEHRRFVDWSGRRVPVLSLSYEARAYERLGREERAALLRRHAGVDGPTEE